MLPLIWRPEARRDVREIVDYISDHNPAAAERLGDAIEHTADRLPDHPYLHRPGRVPGTREAIVHPNYILIYRVTEIIEFFSRDPRSATISLTMLYQD